MKDFAVRFPRVRTGLGAMTFTQVGLQRRGSGRSRLDSLTGLRFLAALVVFALHVVVFFPALAYHAVLRLVVQGGTGVSFFFVLSGFVLTWSHREGDTASSFLRRRVARIFPSHFVVWAATGILLAGVAAFPRRAAVVASLFLVSPWVPNVPFVETMNVPAWSLGCEVFFYALFPLLLPRLVRLNPTQRRAAIGALVLFMLLLAFVASPAAYPTKRYWALYFFPPSRLPEFVIGMLLALEVSAKTWPRVRLGWAAAFAALGYLAAGWVPWPYSIAVVTVVPFSVLIAAAAQRDSNRAQSERRDPLASSVLVRLGVWSYAFYLVHWPLLVAVAHLFPGRHTGIRSFELAAGTFVVVLVAAGLLHTIVERPMERILRGGDGAPRSGFGVLTGRRLVAAITVGASVLGVGGVAVAAVGYQHGATRPAAVVDSLRQSRAANPPSSSSPAGAGVATSAAGSPAVGAIPSAAGAVQPNSANGRGATSGGLSGHSPIVAPPTAQRVAVPALCDASSLLTTIATDRTDYSAAQPVRITLTLSNKAGSSCDVQPEPCYPQVAVETATGARVWQYGGPTAGGTCPQPARRTLGAGGSMDMTAVWNPPVPVAGGLMPYQVTGTWLGGPGDMSTPVQISAP